MKTLLILLLLAVTTTATNAQQIKGVEFWKARYSEDIPDDEFDCDGLFLKTKGKEGILYYAYAYDLTPVRYKHCSDKLAYILEDNGGVRMPDVDDSLIPSYIDNEYIEYSRMTTAIVAGSAELWQAWYIKDWVLVWLSTEDMIIISMWKEPKGKNI